MKKILIVEDITKVTDEIQQKIPNFEYYIFNTAQKFIYELEFSTNKNEFENLLSSIDLFVLDFSLEKNYTILNSNIYSTIIANKKNSSKIVSISMYDQDYILAQFNDYISPRLKLSALKLKEKQKELQEQNTSSIIKENNSMEKNLFIYPYYSAFLGKNIDNLKSYILENI